FFTQALYAGLDLPIIDPLNRDMMDTVKASKVLLNQDKNSVDYLNFYENIQQKKVVKTEKTHNTKDLSEIIKKETNEEAKDTTINLLKVHEPLAIVNKYIIPALDIVGEQYEKGEIFLPQLIRAAETVKSAFEIIKEKINMASGGDI